MAAPIRSRRVASIIIGLAFAAGATATMASHGSPYIDLTTNAVTVTHDGAIYTQGGLGAGTGTFDPYLTLQATPTEQGYNFCDEVGCPAKQFDEVTGGGRTHELLASAVPVTTILGVNYRQFFLDSQDPGSDPYMSVDTIKLFADTQSNLTGYNAGAETFSNDAAPTAQRIWNMDETDDVTILMNTQGLESGSGVSDISVLVPDSVFPAGCSYGSTTCTKYIIFYTEAGNLGTYDNKNWDTGSGFEEWKTELRPVVNVSKTANVSLTRTYPWSIAKEADGDPDHIDLFAGQSGTVNWTVTATVGTPVDSALAVSGSITLTNPSGANGLTSMAAEISSVVDVLGQGSTNTPLTVTCPQSFPFTIAAQGTVICSYTGPPPNQTNGTNTATATVVLSRDKHTNQITASQDYSGTAAVDFGAAAVNAVDDCVVVTDDHATPANTADDTTLDSSLCFDESPGVYHFSTGVGPFSVANCGSTTVTNTAYFETLDDSNDTTAHGSASDSVTVSCYTLGVSKTATPTFTRTYPWSITKEANGEPDHIDLFAGQSATITWTITATAGTPVDSGQAVSGTITISNPAPIIATGVSVSDSMTGGLDATVDCDPGAGVATTVDVPAKVGATNGTVTCTYSRSLPDSTTLTNTATATLASTNYTGTAAVNFADATPDWVDECISVYDDPGTPGTTADDTLLDASLCWNESPGVYNPQTTVGPFTTETCGSTTVTDTGRFVTNDTAGTGSATDSVTVSCYTLGVAKDANTTFTRAYDWGVAKTRVFASGEVDGDNDPLTLTLDPNQTFTLTYEVVVSVTGHTDSGWAVAGTITLTNPAPIAADGVLVSDVVSTGIDATVDCDPGAGTSTTVSVPAKVGATNGSATCAYAATLPDGTSRTNTATATYAGVAYTGSAAVTFGSTPSTQIDECVVVTDDNGTLDTGDDVPLDSSLCADEAPHTYTTTIDVGPFTVCGTYTLTNTAHIITVDDTNDTGESHDSSYTVTIDVPCPEGCTLTQGYWKTHNDSFKGGAPTDETWLLLGPAGENTTFFLSGQTWFEVFWTAPKGNAYYILAHQYMAAQLNMLAGADGSAITTAFSDATTLFQTYTPAQIGALKGKTGNALRSQFITLAGTLGAYNEGTIGPGHCDEDGSSTAGGASTTFAVALDVARIDRHRLA